jgi:hypothetical protein
MTKTVASLIPKLAGWACLGVWNVGGQAVLPEGWLRVHCELVVHRRVSGKTTTELQLSCAEHKVFIAEQVD